MRSLGHENSRISNWLAFGLVAGTGVLMLRISWRRWTHAIIDFGRELYVPWRLSEGEVLYRDLAYFNGPLSPYLNSLVFRLAGDSYMSLVVFNIGLLAIGTWMLFRLLSRLGNRTSATMGCVLFLVIFALADLTGFGNYNFVTPYSHEMTHASLLSLGLFLLLGTILGQPTAWRFSGLGVLLGLIFLTKPEFFLAASMAVAIGLTLGRFRQVHRSSGRGSPSLTDILWLIGGLLVPPLTAWVLFLVPMSPTAALRGVLGSWEYVFLDELTELAFYRHGMGIDHPGLNLTSTMLWSGILACVLGPALLAARYLGPRSGSPSWLMLATAVWTGITLIFFGVRFDLANLPRPLPILVTAAIAAGSISFLQSRRSSDGVDTTDILFTAYQVFALVLLGKLALHPRFEHYGFALALPATMIAVILLLDRVPTWLERAGGSGRTFRASACVFLSLTTLAFFWPSMLVYRGRTLAFGHDSDMFWVEEEYRVMQQLLETLPSFVSTDETLLVLPEGAMLNFQTRRRNPTPYFNFMPPELIMFGESEIVAALGENPPDCIVLIKRNTREYGFNTIGDGFGEQIMNWVSQRYPIVETIEDPELWGSNFGKAFILRRSP